VEVYLQIQGGDRSEWQVLLKKGGTSSRLWTAANAIPNAASPMFADPDPSGGIDHLFLSNAFWGEDPEGLWEIIVTNPSGTQDAAFVSCGIILHMGNIVFDDKPGRYLNRSTVAMGLSKNGKETGLIIQSGGRFRTAGDVLMNAGELRVDGTLEAQPEIAVSKLDLTFRRAKENLAYARGVRLHLQGGRISGKGKIVLPAGTDGRGGVIHSGGELQPGTGSKTAALSLGRPNEPTSYNQQTAGTIRINVRDTKNFGKLIIHGSADLSGILSVVTDNRAHIRPGTRLNGVIKATALNGAIRAVSADIPGTDLCWKLEQGAKSIDLVAVKK